MRKPINYEGYKSKIEEIGEFPFYGPFTLFDELYKVINESSNPNLQYETSFIDNIALKEIKNYSQDGKLLQLDIPNLRINHEDVFWNLVFLFINCRIDLKLICPYENDPALPKYSKKNNDYMDQISSANVRQSANASYNANNC